MAIRIPPKRWTVECRALYDGSQVGRPSGPYRSRRRAQNKVDERNGAARRIFGVRGTIYYRVGDTWERS